MKNIKKTTAVILIMAFAITGCKPHVKSPASTSVAPQNHEEKKNTLQEPQQLSHLQSHHTEHLAETVVENESSQNKNTYSQETTPQAEQIPRPYKDLEEEAIMLINIEREKVGLTPLEPNNAYYDLVNIRAEECVEYWSHTRPNGTSYFTIYTDAGDIAGIKMLGENLGAKFRSVEKVTQALMNSENHRNTILTPEYTHICIAIVVMEENEDPTKTLYAMAQHFYCQKEE